MRLNLAMLPSVERILKSTTPTQGTTAWLDWRKSRLTASDACSLTGNAEKTRASLLIAKTSPVAQIFTGNSFTVSGHLNEPIAAERYRLHTGRVLHTDLKPVEHPQYCWLAASLDGVTECGRNVEIKCLHTDKTLKKPKPIHVKQSQIQMACTDLTVTDLVYYYPNIIENGDKKMDVHEVKFDRSWFDSVVPKFKSFADDLAAAHACCYNLELEDWSFDQVMQDIEAAFDHIDMDDLELAEQLAVWPIDTTQAEWL
jgi:putative phage-type endonuclease